MGIHKQTTVKKDVTKTTNVKFDEHIFFEPGKVDNSDIRDAVIEIKIQNKGFFSSDLVGTFPISTSTIYNLENHVVHHQLIAMTNPEAEDKGKTSAFMALSINLIGPGDEST